MHPGWYEASHEDVSRARTAIRSVAQHLTDQDIARCEEVSSSEVRRTLWPLVDDCARDQRVELLSVARRKVTVRTPALHSPLYASTRIRPFRIALRSSLSRRNEAGF